ncbi:MAG: DHH family phosphoesterase [Candidatus Pacearchaeota archaeon]
MKNEIKDFVEKFLKYSNNKKIRVISHYDTDGICSAAILIKVLKRLRKEFSVRIIKGIEEETIKEEIIKAENEVLFFSDLGSSNLEYFNNLKSKIFIIDHHEINKNNLNENIVIINPHINNNKNLCSSALCYLFAKEISEKNTDLAKIAILGMIGDRHEKEITKEYYEIIKECKDIEIKKSLLIFSATRPLKRALEYSTNFYIPKITGSSEGVNELLKDLGISQEKSLYELDETETSKLITKIILNIGRNFKEEEIIGNIFITKFFNRKEDMREISVIINACSRLGYSDIAIAFCMEMESFYERAQEIYIKYRKELINSLKTIEELEKIRGNGFVIINGKEKIKDVLIGTICSILSSSKFYENGTILIGMAYNCNKIKISARIVGKSEKNLKELLERAVINIKAEVGGHKEAAGCLIRKEDEEKFIEEIKKNLDIQIIKI